MILYLPTINDSWVRTSVGPSPVSRIPISLLENKLLSNFFSHGHISVPFFFLLSGFVLFYSYHNYSFDNTKDIIKYVKNRFIRLAPIYYMAMGLSLVLLIRHQIIGDPLTIQENVFKGFIHLTFLQAIFPFKEILNYWNIHSWSLSVEMFLYLCSPFIIKKLHKTPAKKAVILFLLMTLFNGFIYFFKINPEIKLFGLSSLFAPLYLPTFISGSALAKVFLEYRVIISRYTTPLFIISSLLLLASFVTELNTSFYSSFNPFYHVAFSTLTLGSCFPNVSNKSLSMKVIFILGEASYAMYIFQAPIKFATQQFLSKILQYKFFDGPLFSSAIFTSITIFSLIISLYIDPFLRKKLSLLFLRIID